MLAGRPVLTSCLGQVFRLALTRRGFVGSFPIKVRQDDIVCQIQHMTQPAVLRRMGNYYIFVGTCYVQGFENEWKAENLHSKGLKIETIRLR